MRGGALQPPVEYLPDESVDPELDEQLRNLLTTSYPEPDNAPFFERRYFREPYRHRWVIRDPDGALVAHSGAHEKTVQAGGARYAIGGIAEVCVHPAYRGRGYVHLMLGDVHRWLAERGFCFAVLFGDPRIYSSSGYLRVTNLSCGADRQGAERADAMVRPLGDLAWPEGAVFLAGPTF